MNKRFYLITIILMILILVGFIILFLKSKITGFSVSENGENEKDINKIKIYFIKENGEKILYKEAIINNLTKFYEGGFELIAKNQTWIFLDGDFKTHINAGLIEGLGSNLESTNITVSFWVNSTNTTEVWTPFGTQNGDDTDTMFSAYLNDNVSAHIDYTGQTTNYIAFNLRDEFGSELRGATHGHINISDGEWHHIVLTAKPNLGYLAIYIDGKKQPIDSAVIRKNRRMEFYDFHDFENFLAVGAINPGKIGDWNTETEQTVPGSLDEFRIYNASLNDAEVSSLFTTGRYTDNSPLGNIHDESLLLYYSFNENSGDIAHDNSHFRHDGKIIRGLFENDGINVSLREGIDYMREKNEI